MSDLKVSLLRWQENTLEDLPYDKEEILDIREKLFFNGNDRLRAAGVVYDYSREEMTEHLNCLYNPIALSEHFDIGGCYHTESDPLRLTEIQDGIIVNHMLNAYTIVSQPRQMGVSTAMRVTALFEAMFQGRSVTIVTRNDDSSRHQYDMTLDLYSTLPYHLQTGIISMNSGKRIRFENGAQINFVSLSKIGGHTPDTLLIDNLDHANHRYLLNLINTMQYRRGSRIMVCDTGMNSEIATRAYQNLLAGTATPFTFGAYQCEWERVDPNWTSDVPD